MKKPFKDHFSGHAADYARYRPRYPAALFVYLASLCEDHELAWDCGTGNGQVAHALVSHFAHVMATDASAEQVAQARPHERITYQVAPAENSPLSDATADLVTVGQALHWFDVEPFYEEATRVLKPGGVLAVWAYDHLRANPVLDAVVRRYAEAVVGPYWPPERRFVDAHYQTFSFPFPEEQPPVFDMTQTWTLDDLLGYLSTWSATRRYIEARGTDPLDQVREELSQAWGVAEDEQRIRWPLHLRVGRKPGGSLMVDRG